MIIAYTIYNLMLAFLAKKQIGKLFNPVTIYALVWEIALLFHECGLITYYQITLYCWLIIFLFEFIFFIGCIYGYRTVLLGITDMSISYTDPDEEKRQLRKWIIITLIISGIGILSTFARTIQLYGSDLISSTTDIYANRVYNGEDNQVIPYVGTFIYIEMALSGVYLKKYGFRPLLLVGFVFVFLSSLTSGARAGIVFNAVFFISAYVLANTERERRKLSLKQKVLMIIIIIAVIVMLNIITNQRVAGIQLTYATDRYKEIFGDNVAIYKVISYIANPVGTLNEFLKSPDFSFGHNTFLPILNIFARFGWIDRVTQYQAYFYTPMRCNVGTWIREIIEDFTVPGAMIVAILFAFAVGYQFREANTKNTTGHIIVSSSLILIVTLSFFDWRFRTSGLWIAILFGYFIGRSIDRKSRKPENEVPMNQYTGSKQVL